MKTLEDVLVEITPQPDPDFVADMERRMQEGFPAAARKRRLPQIPALRPRAWAGAAASLMLALVVTVSLVERSTEPQPTGEAQVAKALGEPQRQAALDSGGGAAESTIAPAPQPIPPPPGDDLAPRAANRRVELNAQMTLASDADQFDDVADSIFRVTDRHKGFVLRSSVTHGDSGPNTGFFELRVPSDELEQTLNELSRVATVRSRSESGTDVTAPFVSLRDRLRSLRAERKSLLRRLEVAPTETAAAAIRQRLRIVGRRITVTSAQLRSARERTQYATVAVELVDRDSGPAATRGQTDEALDDAVGYLEDVLNFLIRAAGVLLPVALAAILVWLGAAYARRRARDRALA